MVQSIEDYSLQNISNRINLRRSQASILYNRFPVFLRWTMHHVSMYFLRSIVFRFLPREKRSCFWEKNTIFPDSTRKIICSTIFFGKTIFSGHPEKENMVFRAVTVASLDLLKWAQIDHLHHCFHLLLICTSESTTAPLPGC